MLDEPEAALSPQNCLTLLRRIHELVEGGSQFVIATHSPLLLAYPGATIYALEETGLETIGYDETPAVSLTRTFLDAPERFVRELFRD
jgi:predicted ATPase